MLGSIMHDQDYLIRPAAQDDANRLALLGSATYLETYSTIVTGDDIVACCRETHSADAYSRLMSSDDTKIWIAQLQKGLTPIGYCVTGSPSPGIFRVEPGDCELKRLYVLKPFQRGGIGSSLMGVVLALYRSLNYRRLLIQVSAANRAAFDFYGQKFNAIEIGARNRHVGDNEYQSMLLAIPLGDPSESS